MAPPLEGQAHKLMELSVMLVRLGGSMGILRWQVGPGGLFRDCGLLVSADIFDLIESWMAKALRLVSVTETASGRNFDSYLKRRIKALMRTGFCSLYKYNGICQREGLLVIMRARLDMGTYLTSMVI